MYARMAEAFLPEMIIPKKGGRDVDGVVNTNVWVQDLQREYTCAALYQRA